MHLILTMPFINIVQQLFAFMSESILLTTLSFGGLHMIYIVNVIFLRTFIMIVCDTEVSC